MTVGFVTPTEGYTEADLVRQQDATPEQQRGMWHATGRDVLGYGQDRNGLWRQRQAEQTSGYPAALIDAARSACQAETEAYRAFEAKHNQALAEISRRGLAGGMAEYHLQNTRGDAGAVYNEAARNAMRACAQLGEAVEQIRADRTIVNAAPQQLATIDAWAQAQRDQVNARVEGAKARLLRWGVA